MIELLPVSIGVGLVVSVLFSEIFGITAGGMIVPGYFALHLTKPLDLALTLAASFMTFAAVRGLASVMIIYGRRRTALMILVGYLSGMLVRSFFGIPPEGAAVDYVVIGFIIPGLVAIWLDRQGVVETLTSLFIAAAVVRLVLILVYGMRLEP